ncbi:MAG: hypothetical protein LZF60_360092 [Nitrospira sp.]|nr:MAG: hypothetical protein LZF60_360092 [Nitrospira sp.]
MIDNPLSPHAPLNHCPPSLVPIMLEVLAAHHAAMPRAAEGIHEKTVEMAGSLYDHLLVLYYQAFGTPFLCEDSDSGEMHTLSFIDKPAVVRQTVTDQTRQCSIHLKVMKLPTVSSG